MAKRGGKRTRSNKSPSAKSVRPSTPQAERSLLRHPSQILSESHSRKTKSSGPSTVTYRNGVLLPNKVFITNNFRDTQHIRSLVEDLTNMENTLVSHENDFITNRNDPRITSSESSLTVSKDIPSRMCLMAPHLPGLSSKPEKSWEIHVGIPLLSPFSFDKLFNVSGGEKWHMIYEAPEEAVPLSTPVPDFVCSISTKDHDSEIHDVGIRPALLQKLQTARFPYSANSSPTELIYPFLIVEMKSNMGNMFFAENQAGSSAAIALTLLRRLRQEARSDKRLPVFALTSEGKIWQMFVCYESTVEDVRCIKICNFLLVNIADPEGAHKLMVVIDRIKEWARNVYIPTINEMMNSVVSQS